jgi:diguanylate cyclase (GGDEF)-like protein
MSDDSKQSIPDVVIESVEGDLPALKEIEQFARGGAAPKSCHGSSGDCAAKILLALTHKVYPPHKADELWRAIVRHEKWVTERLGRRAGISVAALDYLLNVESDWDEAVIADVNHIETLESAATLDGLTGLYVREIFDQWLEKAIAESIRYGNPISIFMADIDDFKDINDTYGHQTGDQVLTSIGSDMLSNLRNADFAARYGGEELVAILPHTDSSTAYRVAEKIRKAVRDRFANDLEVTISIGVASWRDDMSDPADLVQAADRALYTAKEVGKDRVVLAEESPINNLR